MGGGGGKGVCLETGMILLYYYSVYPDQFASKNACQEVH